VHPSGSAGRGARSAAREAVVITGRITSRSGRSFTASVPGRFHRRQEVPP